MMSDDYRFNSLSRFLLHRTCVNTMFNTCRFLLNGERQRCESQSRANRMISPEPGGPKWNGNENGKDLHTFVWSSSSSPVSEGGKHVFRGGADVGAHPKENDDFGQGKLSFGNKQGLGGTTVKGLFCLILVRARLPNITPSLVADEADHDAAN